MKQKNVLKFKGTGYRFIASHLSLLTYFLFLAVAGGSDGDVHIIDIDSKASSGTLLRLDAEKVMFSSEAGTLELSPERILKLQTAATFETRKTSELFLVVHFRDGSRTIASDLSLSDQTIRLTRIDGTEQSFGLDLLQGIRFSVPWGEAAGEFPENIQKILRTRSAEDRLLIAAGDAVDFYGGIIRGIGPETVPFELDGEVLAIPRKKIVALLFHQKDSPPVALPFCRLTERDGTSWELTDLTFDRVQERFRWKTVLGIEGITPFSEWAAADFTKTNTIPLFELAPVSVRYTPAVLWMDQREQEPLLLWQQLAKSHWEHSVERSEAASDDEKAPISQADSTADRLKKPNQFPLQTLRRIQLDGKVYQTGVTLSAKTVLEFSWTDDYQTLRGLAGIDDRIRPSGRVKLSFQSGGTILYETILRGDHPAVPLNVNLNGVKKLTILVDFPAGIDDGTRLNLVEMQLVK